jgi:hypothetical protein
MKDTYKVAKVITADPDPVENPSNGMPRPFAIYNGTAGASITLTVGGDSIEFKSVPVGILEVEATHMTATTSTNVIALWR